MPISSNLIHGGVLPRSISIDGFLLCLRSARPRSSLKSRELSGQRKEGLVVGRDVVKGDDKTGGEAGAGGGFSSSSAARTHTKDSWLEEVCPDLLARLALPLMNCTDLIQSHPLRLSSSFYHQLGTSRSISDRWFSFYVCDPSWSSDQVLWEDNTDF